MCFDIAIHRGANQVQSETKRVLTTTLRRRTKSMERM
jgi:hypothetical protein